MRKVLILTDQKGWHYKQLKKSFENRDISVESSNLDDLSIAIQGKKNQIIKNNGELLTNITDVFVRHIPGGTLEEVIINLNILKVFESHNINVMNTSANIETTVPKLPVKPFIDIALVEDVKPYYDMGIKLFLLLMTICT